jgi:hypothetical protein
MLKKSVSLSCSFGLSGLSGFLVERNRRGDPNQPDKQNKPSQLHQMARLTGLVLDVPAIEFRHHAQ